MGQFVLKGTSVSSGFALGPARIHATNGGEGAPRNIRPEDVGAEIDRFDAALARSEDQLRRNIRFATERVGAQDARILESQLQFLADVEIRDRARRNIREHQVDAAAAVERALAHFVRPFEKALPAVRRDLIQEVRSAWAVVLNELRGRNMVVESQPAVIVTDELVPWFATLIERGSVAAVLAEAGGRYSHGAILARSFGVPAIVGVRDLLRRVQNGALVAVNGDDGTVLVEPTEPELRLFEARRIARLEQRRELAAAAIHPARTRDGARVQVMANVESLRDLDGFDLRTVDGIGLYRTEYLYLDRLEFPSEDDQYNLYRRALERLGDRPVVFRTLDSGGDKPLPYFQTPKEANPALGWRGLRISLEMPDLFVPQLRALLRAAVHGNARILLPMVTSVEEVVAVRTLLASIREDFRAAGIPHREDVPLGAMIEVPAAAAVADGLAEVADFLSIGTNDLVQYLTGADRDNPRVGHLYDPYHPGVLRTIRDVARRAADSGREVSLCGELAADPQTTPLLVGLGLRSLSMAPVAIATVKSAVRSMRILEAGALASSSLSCRTSTQVRGLVDAFEARRLGFHSAGATSGSSPSEISPRREDRDER